MRRRVRYLRILTIVLVLGGLAPAAWGLDAEALTKGGEGNEPWHITADTISYDDRARRYVAEGQVRISRGPVRLTADRVRFDHRTMDAAAHGHVVLVSGKDILIGDRVEINLQDQVGTVTQGTVFLEENHFYIRGAKIEKLGEDTYAAEQVSISSCDGPAPAWKITGRNLQVTLEGYGVVRHAALWARQVPVLYTPLFVFPAKRERQTGLLPPEFGSSSRKGTFYVQPFFWAINEQSDLTYAPHYLSERGLQNSLEYRYILDPRSRGTFMADYLRDREVDDGRGDNSDDWGYTDDNYLRPDEDRYWIRLKHDQGLPFGFTGRIDLDVVSDQDYLTEFRSGYSGFDETRDYFRDAFGRDLDDYNDPVRTNQGIVTRHWDAFSLNGGVVWLDDTTRGWTDAVEAASPLPKLDTQLQNLPLIRFDALRQQIGGTPLLFNMDTEWTYLHSEDNTRAARIDLHPRLTWPFRLGDVLYVEPSAGLRQTAWFVQEFQEYVGSETDKDKNSFRTLYDLKLDLSSEFSRVFDVNGTDGEAVRHTILPRVVYEYIPEEEQDEHPFFFQQPTSGSLASNFEDNFTALDDGVNRIEAANRITYSITNTLTSKSPAPDAAGVDAEKPPAARYNDFLRVKLEQSYDVREAREDDPAERLDPERRRPFSPIRGELEYFPTRYLRLKADAEYDVYDSRLVSRNLYAVLSSPRGDELRLSYRFAEPGARFFLKDGSDRDIESLFASLRLKLPFRFTAYASNEYDFEESERIETILGLLYEAQCWSLDVRYQDEEDDQEIAFLFHLYGLGAIGLQ